MNQSNQMIVFLLIYVIPAICNWFILRNDTDSNYLSAILFVITPGINIGILVIYLVIGIGELLHKVDWSKVGKKFFLKR